MIRLKVKSRFGFRNGDYIGYISNEKIQTVFFSNKVAQSTVIAMKQNKEVFDYDNDRTITQTFKGKSAELLLEESIGLLEAAKKSLYPTQRLQWEVEM